MYDDGTDDVLRRLDEKLEAVQERHDDAIRQLAQTRSHYARALLARARRDGLTDSQAIDFAVNEMTAAANEQRHEDPVRYGITLALHLGLELAKQPADRLSGYWAH